MQDDAISVPLLEPSYVYFNRPWYLFSMLLVPEHWQGVVPPAMLEWNASLGIAAVQRCLNQDAPWGTKTKYWQGDLDIGFFRVKQTFKPVCSDTSNTPKLVLVEWFRRIPPFGKGHFIRRSRLSSGGFRMLNKTKLGGIVLREVPIARHVRALIVLKLKSVNLHAYGPN